MSKASAKGYRGEIATQEAFAAVGLESYRPRAGQPEDAGDILGIEGLTIQVKNYDSLVRAVREGLAVLADQKVHGGTRWGVLAVPRRRKGWLAVMPLPEFAALYADYLRLLGKENHHELRTGSDEVR